MADKASRIVEAIVKDLSDRNGLSDTWDSIDPDIRADIRDKWLDITRSIMEEK